MALQIKSNISNLTLQNTSNEQGLFDLIREILRNLAIFGRQCASKCLNILKNLPFSLVDLIDNKQFWKYAKLIPLLNTIFGSARCIRNLYNGNWAEAIKSILYAVGGLAAIFLPIYLGVGCMLAFLLGGAINNIIGGFGDFIVDMWNDESLRTAKWSDIEDTLTKELSR